MTLASSFSGSASLFGASLLSRLSLLSALSGTAGLVTAKLHDTGADFLSVKTEALATS